MPRNSLTALLSIIILVALPARTLAGRGANNTVRPPIKETKNTPRVPIKELETWVEPTSGMKFVKVEGGCFDMGQSPVERRQLKREMTLGDYEMYYADEVPRHKVCLDEFWMGIHEVTQREWQKIMGYNPAVFQEYPDNPVEMVSWEDAQHFINKLNAANDTSMFRLPTEAEWEYAARAKTTSMYNTGDSLSSSSQANYNGSFPFGLNLRDTYRKSTTPVGSFPANAFGLYDMHGNVWEWCNDWYAPDYYQKSPAKNPMGPESGQMKVLRGGSWFRYSAHLRSATRYKNRESGQFADTGFRLVKSPIRTDNYGDRPIIFDKDF